MMNAANTADRFADLFTVVEDLIKRIADSDDPQILRMRAKVRAQLIALKTDMAPIAECSGRYRYSEPARPDVDEVFYRGGRVGPRGHPALAALASAAVALTLFHNP